MNAGTRAAGRSGFDAANEAHARGRRPVSWLLLLLIALLAIPAWASAGDAVDELGLLQPPTRPQPHPIPSAAPDSVRAGTQLVAQAAADWLLTQQQPGGGFPWSPGSTATESNVQGAVARGLLQAWQRTRDPAHLAGAVANGDCQITLGCIPGKSFPVSGAPRFATHDPLYLIELSQLTGNPVYASYLGTHFWAPLAAGTYSDASQDAATYAQTVLASRTSGGIRELAAWDLSKVAVAAHLAGEAATRGDVFTAILASLEAPDGASFRSYDVFGLAGAVWAAASTGTPLDPQAGAWASDNSVADLATTLAALQLGDGGFPVGSGGASGSAQATSFALQALHAADPIGFRPAIQAGFAYLESLQQPDGQFLAFAGASPTQAGGNEVHGETLEAYSIAYLGTRYVAAAGGADSGDCSEQAAPCATIGYAVAQADPYDTITIAAGTYIHPVTIAKPGLVLQPADPATAPVLTRVGGGTNQPLLVVNNVRDVQVRGLRFHIDQSFVAEGILASGFVDGLQIVGNRFVASHTGGGASTFGMRNAISINVVGNSQGLPRVNGSSVLIEDNLVEGVLAAGLPSLRSGISMDAGIGQIRGNDIVSATQDITVRFATVTGASSGAEVLVQGNTLRGRGLQVTSANAGIGAIRIEDNLIQAPAAITDALALPADWSLVRLIHNPNAIPTLLAGNTFRGHRGNFRGVLLQNYPAAQFQDNLFEPAAGASDFVSLVVSNRELTTDNPPAAPALLVLTATGNTFAGSGVPDAGRAVEFINDNDAGGSAAFGALLFGAPGSENDFDPGHRWYFRLRDETCDTRVPPGQPPQCSFLDYNGVGNLPNTQVRPFHGLVTAPDNRFGGLTPAAMDAAQRAQLQARTYDNAANPALGEVDYGLASGLAMTYVDDDYAGQPYGASFLFNHPDPAADGQIVVVGVNAFASIDQAASAVDAGGTVWVAAGSYAAGNTVAKRLTLAGAGNGINPGSDTVIATELVLAASGNPGDPLQVRNLRVSNPGGNAVVVGGGRSHWLFRDVHFADSVNGINFVAGTPGASHITVAGTTPGACAFAGNTNAIRTSSTTHASNVEVDGCVFQDNQAGIVLFGASASGNGQHLDWRIANSVFAGNDNADASAFGGGIWLKTGGAGSVIDGFEVVGSVFRDNGSANLLNRNGINLRARPGTTLRNVRICDNLFEETAQPGTQAWGILVFDDTGNSGYEPVEICADNAFNGLQASVSGREQNDLRGTWPVVNITGGSIPGTEFINGLVNRLSDSAKFITISEALADAGTLDGETIQVPAGIYRENVTINRNGVVLQGVGHASVVDGTGLAGSGIDVATGRAGVRIENLTVRRFTQQVNSNHACISAQGGNHGLRVTGVQVHDCKGSGRGGIYVNGIGGVDDVTIHENLVHDIASTSAARGIVIWNGFKTNIRITDNQVSNIPSCCGIELQDGSASGVTVTGNTVVDVGDSGMGFVQLTGGAGPNLIADNYIENTGRFGIELKIPDGNGQESGDGSVVVRDNTVVRPATPSSTDVRDVAGIAVIRRSFSALTGAVDVTRGVVVRDNTVSGWTQPSANEGHGIVLEGTLMRAFGNTVSGSDVGLQLQAGNDGFPGDSDQGATNAFFSRGNAQQTCVQVGANQLAGSSEALRTVSNPAGAPLQVAAINVSQGTEYCSIQAAIDAAVAGEVVEVLAGRWAESINLDKAIVLRGPFAGVHGDDPNRGTAEAVIVQAGTGVPLLISATGAVVDGLTFADITGERIVDRAGGANAVALRNNRLIDFQSTSSIGGGINVGGAENWTIADNLFQDFSNGMGANQFAMGIRLDSASNAQIRGNTFRRVQSVAMQLSQNTGSVIADNVVDGEVAGFTNAGAQVVTSTGVEVSGNRISGAFHGLLMHNGNSNTAFFCNEVDNSTFGFTAQNLGGGGPSTVQVFHNALQGNSADAANSNSFPVVPAPVIGSNWFGGGVASTQGALQLADALVANPFGQALCGNRTPATVSVESGSPQSTPVGTAFGAPLAVVVRDGLGGTVPGASVTYSSPSAPGAVLAPVSAGSDFNGRASVAASADLVAGSYQVVADAAAAPVAQPALFDLVNLAGAAAGVAVVSGDGQDTQVATAFPAPLVVAISDAQGNPVADGTAVVFTANAAGNGASLSQASIATTTTGGIASASVAANTVVGDYTVTAAAGTVTAAFALGNLPGEAVTVELTGGDGQSTVVGTGFGQPLAVSVEDAHGNPVADGTQVSFTAVAGGNGASIQEASPITSTTTAGQAQIPVSANLVAGDHQVAVSAGTGSASFDLTNLAAAPALLVKVAGDDQSAPVGAAVPVAPQVRVEDVNGNPIEGAVVAFTAGPGGGAVSGGTALTDAAGLAAVGAWTLGGEGTHVLAANLPGTPAVAAVQFSATAVASNDVGVAVTSATGYVRVGEVHDHLVLVANEGNGALNAVRIEVPLPAEHAAATAQWLCVPAAGASCGTAGTGVGPVDILVDLPVGGSVVILTAAEVLNGPTEEVVVEATVTAAGDLVPDNDTDQAATPVVLFRNGFELGGNGANGDGEAAVGELELAGDVLVLPLVERTGHRLPGPWLRAVDAAAGSATAFRIDRVTLSGETWLRVGTGQPGRWMRADQHVGLALGGTVDTVVLTVDTGQQQLDLPLSAPPAGPLTVLALPD